MADHPLARLTAPLRRRVTEAVVELDSDEWHPQTDAERIAEARRWQAELHDADLPAPDGVSPWTQSVGSTARQVGGRASDPGLDEPWDLDVMIARVQARMRADADLYGG